MRVLSFIFIFLLFSVRLVLFLSFLLIFLSAEEQEIEKSLDSLQSRYISYESKLVGEKESEIKYVQAWNKRYLDLFRKEDIASWYLLPQDRSHVSLSVALSLYAFQRSLLLCDFLPFAEQSRRVVHTIKGNEDQDDSEGDKAVRDDQGDDFISDFFQRSRKAALAAKSAASTGRRTYDTEADVADDMDDPGFLSYPELRILAHNHLTHSASLSPFTGQDYKPRGVLKAGAYAKNDDEKLSFLLPWDPDEYKVGVCVVVFAIICISMKLLSSLTLSPLLLVLFPCLSQNIRAPQARKPADAASALNAARSGSALKTRALQDLQAIAEAEENVCLFCSFLHVSFCSS